MKRASIATLLLLCYWILAFLPLLATSIAYQWMPDTVAVHFGIGGTPDRWAGKWEVFIIPAAILALSFFMWYGTRSSRRDSAPSGGGNTVILIIICTALIILNIVTAWVIVVNIPELQKYAMLIDFLRLIYVCLGILMILIGWLAPKLSEGTFLGLRVPWRLTDDAWILLQYFSQKLFMAAGVVIVFLCGIVLSGIAASTCVLVTLFITTMAVLGYGWRLKNTA